MQDSLGLYNIPGFIAPEMEACRCSRTFVSTPKRGDRMLKVRTSVVVDMEQLASYEVYGSLSRAFIDSMEYVSRGLLLAPPTTFVTINSIQRDTTRHTSSTLVNRTLILSSASAFGI